MFRMLLAIAFVALALALELDHWIVELQRRWT